MRLFYFKTNTVANFTFYMSHFAYYYMMKNGRFIAQQGILGHINIKQTLTLPAHLALYIKTVLMGFFMAVRNLKDGNKLPWLCMCYPQCRKGKRIRKRFAIKG